MHPQLRLCDHFTVFFITFISIVRVKSCKLNSEQISSINSADALYVPNTFSLDDNAWFSCEMSMINPRWHPTYFYMHFYYNIGFKLNGFVRRIYGLACKIIYSKYRLLCMNYAKENTYFQSFKRR